MAKLAGYFMLLNRALFCARQRAMADGYTALYPSYGLPGYTEQIVGWVKEQSDVPIRSGPCARLIGNERRLLANNGRAPGVVSPAGLVIDIFQCVPVIDITTAVRDSAGGCLPCLLRAACL